MFINHIHINYLVLILPTFDTAASWKADKRQLTNKTPIKPFYFRVTHLKSSFPY